MKRANGDIVVNEFESFEATYSGDNVDEFRIRHMLELYWIKILNDLLI